MTDNDVKQIIITVSGLPGSASDLDDSSCLSDLGFTDTMCLDLAEQLDKYAKEQKPGTSVNADEISTGMTVQQIIDLIKQKIS
jgi:hypothetical protein